MMKKHFYIAVITLLTTGYVNSQANLLNAKKVSDIDKMIEEKRAVENDGPLPYGYIDDRDILWSKVVWEFIDLNQKVNFPYYFPIDTTNISKDRRSLFDTLLRAIRQDKIQEVYSDSFFTSKITRAEIDEKLIDIRSTETYADTFKISTSDVEGYMTKGMWYFDKRHGELKYRLLGIAPMGKDVLTIGTDYDDGELYELFWVFYPTAREVLHDAKVFNPKNAAQPLSYDNMINARRYSAVIVREENIYGDRKISDYIRGNSLYQLLEADRIKESIRNKEIDMWNY